MPGKKHKLKIDEVPLNIEDVIGVARDGYQVAPLLSSIHRRRGDFFRR
jgi:hypothetical protein